MQKGEASSSWPERSKAADRHARMKRVTTTLLRFALERSGTKMILIIGHLRSGKSSLFESLTNSTGYSADGIDSVTKEWQIGKAIIESSLYLFVDTPGLDDPQISNCAILQEIARLLRMTRDSVSYAGILYVHPVNAPFSEEIKRGLLFLDAFCGRDYAPSITFVTTMWDLQNAKGIIRTNALVESLMTTKWASFMDRGSRIYHHGRRYDNGEPTLEVFDLETEAQARQRTARGRIAHLYPAGQVYAPPLIVEELRANTALEETTAGKFLGMKSMELIKAGTFRSNEPPPEGVDWLGYLFAVLKIPVDIVGSWAMSLWSLIDSLKSRLSSIMNPASIGISIHHLDSQCIEAVISLPGGIKVIVGYGETGPYWRPWSASDENQTGFAVVDDDFEVFVAEPGFDEEDSHGPEYAAFGRTFDSVLSDFQDDTFQQPEPQAQESTWSFCAVM
ncbi:hypothetical protein PENSTE_c013G04032 [Penicillium steckii]|uniref:G domain-containing protein n=1 Tax=Penicillium steckii TaxID=303698 RepID=A0A1V6T3K9_9EURO|nr:hypothetical protein PENSTE_c013G04032 [Penicillium steckii]